MRVIALAALVVALVGVLAADASQQQSMESAMLEEDEVVNLPIQQAPKPQQPTEYLDVNGKPWRIIGNATSWTMCNANALDGWSLSGYSKVQLDSDFNASRWKIGIISGELELMRTIHDPDFSHTCDYEDREMQGGVVFGFHFYKEF